MSPTDRPSVEIAADLVPGVHDALIELRAAIGARAANRVILHVGELLISSYPMMVSDMLATPQSSGPAGQVKIKLSRATSPLLMQCYESLRHGGRGSTVVNLLNRLYMLSEAQPELIEAAVRKRLQRADPDSANTETPAPVQSNSSIAASSPAVAETSDPYRELPTEEIVITGLPDDSGVPGLSPEDDPLSGMVFTF